MPGPVITSRIEIEFEPGSGTYVDVGERCGPVSINRPRVEPGDGASATTLTVTLKNYPAANGFCPFTPDSPGSEHWPNIARDRLIRHTVVVGASTYVRFHGFIDKWSPSMDAGATGQATVTVSASCVLSRYARRKVLSYYGETALSIPNNDYYPFDDPTDSATVRGLSGDEANWPGRDGQIIVPNRPPGGATLSSPDGGHLGDGQISFTRGDDNAPAPVVLIQTRPGELLSGFTASYRLTSDPAGLTDDVVAGYDSDGLRLWRWCASLQSGKIVWTLFDDFNNARSFWDTLAPRDDAWHQWQVTFPTSTSSALVLTEKGGLRKAVGSFVWTYDPRRVAWIVVGGQMIPQRKGKQTNTLQGDVSSLLLQYASGSILTYDQFSVPGVTTEADIVSAFLDNQGSALNTLTGGAITPGLGTDPRQTMYTNRTRTLFDRWNEHMITVAGHLSTGPNGQRRFLGAADCRPTTVSLTLDAADDLDIPSGGWAQVKEEKPTRVSATGPVGAITVIDTAAEDATGQQLDGPTLATSAGTLALARSAAWSLMAPDLARLSQFGLNLTVTGTDKVAAVMGLFQTSRIRVTGLPGEYLGLTYQDVYASGWREEYDGRNRLALFVFDTDPADDPPEGVLDSAEYGRIAVGDGNATATGGTCIGTTGTGTLIVTSATSPQTNAGGEFPRDLNWNGERVTVSAVGGSTSPQTFTVSARGVAPTVARAHLTGEPVDLWHAATVAF